MQTFVVRSARHQTVRGRLCGTIPRRTLRAHQPRRRCDNNSTSKSRVTTVPRGDDCARILEWSISDPNTSKTDPKRLKADPTSLNGSGDAYILNTVSNHHTKNTKLPRAGGRRGPRHLSPASVKSSCSEVARTRKSDLIRACSLWVLLTSSSILPCTFTPKLT